MKTDLQLKADVTSELTWDPSINASGIGVMVKDGVVTLTGHLDTYVEKYEAERAVRRVSGVRGIALELDVKLSPGHKRSNSEIALAAIAALRWNSSVPEEKIKVEVEDGWVTLTGEVDWNYQRTSAERCIRPLIGVRGLFNQIIIKKQVSSEDISTQIKAALTRQAVREADHIGIDVDGGVVTLRGKVHSLMERDAVIGAAFLTRGVARVENKLTVSA